MTAGQNDPVLKAPDPGSPDGLSLRGRESLGGIKSIHLRRGWFKVCSLSSFPPKRLSRLRPIASISSIKMIHGADCCAYFEEVADTGRTRRRTSQRNRNRRSRTERAPHRLPPLRVCFTGSRRTHEERSLRQFAPIFVYFCGLCRKSTISTKGFLRLILTCNIRERDSGLLLDVDLGVALSDAHHSLRRPSGCTSYREVRSSVPTEVPIPSGNSGCWHSYSYLLPPHGLRWSLKTLRKFRVRNSHCIILDKT